MKNLKSIALSSFGLFALLMASNVTAQKKTIDKTQQINSEIVNKKWIPTELFGKKVKLNPKEGRQPSLEFDSKEKRFVATTDCNTLSGTYKINSNKKIKIGESMSTLMACKDAKYEGPMSLLMSKIDHYSIKGKTLTLLNAKNEAVGKFKL